MRRQGSVFLNSDLAGIIEEKDGLFVFSYDQKYLSKPNTQPVSLTLPLQANPFEQKTMFAFFDGLIPEGWLLNIVTENWKINPRDRMSLLLFACKDCIGNVSIVESKASDRA